MARGRLSSSTTPTCSTVPSTLAGASTPCLSRKPRPESYGRETPTLLLSKAASSMSRAMRRWWEFGFCQDRRARPRQRQAATIGRGSVIRPRVGTCGVGRRELPCPRRGDRLTTRRSADRASWRRVTDAVATDGRPVPNLSPVATRVSASDCTVCGLRLIGQVREFLAR